MNASFVNKLLTILENPNDRGLTLQKGYLFYNILKMDIFKWLTIHVNIVPNFIYKKKLFTPNKNVKQISLGLSH